MNLIKQIIFKELNNWVYNDQNQADEILKVIDRSDLPEIVENIVEKIKETEIPQKETDKIFRSITSNGCREMDEIRFHQGVNEAKANF